MARKKSKDKSSLALTDKLKPDWHERLCEEIVVQEGQGNKRLLDNLVKFKNDNTIQDLGFTEQEIQQHLKLRYLELLRDLKNPVAAIAKEYIDIKIAIEKQQMIEKARADTERGDDDILSPTTLHAMKISLDLMKELNKYTLKTKKEIKVTHTFNDEVDSELEGDWRNVINVTPEVQESDEDDEDEQ